MSLGVLAVNVAAWAEPPLPTPGTQANVLASVAQSHLIQQLPKNLLPGLLQVAADGTPAYYPGTAKGCTGLTKCVFGDKTSKYKVVQFGDSHALMWLPALVPEANTHHFRLILEWMPSCPAATVSVWNSSTPSLNTACNTFRTAALAGIKAAAPELVLLADRTTDVRGAGNQLITNAVWQLGEINSIAAILTKTTKVALIGDITAFSLALPGCLGVYQSHIQNCSVANPNPQTHQHFAQERAAALAEKVPYLDPQPWLCTTVCSPVIGKMAAYFDDFHVTATYAEYLSVVWSAAVTPLLTH